MSSRYGLMGALFSRVSKLFNGHARLDAPTNMREFQRACKELAFWSASDAGLSGPIDAFDGGLLHPAADGMYTIRMTLQDSFNHRSASDAANIIVRSLDGLRVLLLLEIDGCRFTYTAPIVNEGIRELCQNFTGRAESTG